MSLTSKEQLDILEHRLEGLNSALQKEMGWAGQVRMREDIDMLMTQMSKLSERIEMESEILQKIKKALDK